MSPLQEMRILANRQHGLFTRRQAFESGMHRNTVGRRVADGTFAYVTPRVLRFGGAEISDWQTPMAAVLDVGLDAVASHLTAAQLWGVPNMPTTPIDVSVERVFRRNEAAIRVHHLTVIPEDQRAYVHDIPVTAPPLTTLLIAAAYGKHRAAQALDHFLAAGDTTMDEMWGLDCRLSKQGRNGLVRTRELLEEREGHQRPSQSNNERRFLHLAHLAGFTNLERQVDIPAAAWIGRVDFLERSMRLIFEIHSERYHTSWAHRRADAERIAKLEAAGYTVVVIWDHEIWFEEELVLERLAKIRRDYLAATTRSL